MNTFVTKHLQITLRISGAIHLCELPKMLKTQANVFHHWHPDKHRTMLLERHRDLFEDILNIIDRKVEIV
jgi:hypothetical protein